MSANRYARFVELYTGLIRDAVEHTEIMNSLHERSTLEEILYFATVQKYCHRIRSATFTRLLRLMKLFYERGKRVTSTAINSSGFTNSYASHYYSWRTGKKRKRFLKTLISINTVHQIITGLKISQHLVHDKIHF